MTEENKLNPEKFQGISSVALEEGASKDNGYHILSDNFDLKKKMIALGCLRCKELRELGECPNCGGKKYRPAFSTDGEIGLFCMDCKSGITHWNCTNCNTDNPISWKTVYEEKKGGCFIATAVYGSYNSPEVIVFRNFRDEFLSKYLFGNLIVKTYYYNSPTIAKIINKFSVLKLIVRNTILEPLLVLLKKHNF